MTFMTVLTTLQGVFKFWDQVTWLITQLQKTPEEKNQQIIIQVGDEIQSFQQTGRPKWG